LIGRYDRLITSALTLLQLTYLLALDKHRHFRLAAESCFVTQPTLSTQIQNLEAELGVTLFDREAHPITPTRIGRRVIDQARAVLTEAERLEQLVQEAAGEMEGELRVGILPTLAPYLLPLVIAPFARRYPGVALTFEELPAGDIAARIRRDLLDAGLVATEGVGRGITEVPLFEEPLVGYVAPDHRLYARGTIRPDVLHPDDLWLMSEGHCFRDQTLALLQGPPPSASEQNVVGFASGNLETLQRLVDRGHGMTLLPLLAVQVEGSHAPESVRPFEPPAPARTVRLLHAKPLVKRRPVEALAAEIVGAVAPILPEGAILYDPPRRREG
jgi:LysR family transcriptional regulator, hydrogen peroxide-inducible genes activator